MSRLKTDLIPEENLIKLNSNKIYTVEDFILCDSNRLTNISGLSFKQVESIRRHLVALYSGKVVKASDKKLIKTRIECLDNLLGGGLKEATVYEICGLSGSGKTQLVLNILANLSLYDDVNCVVLDTKGDFSATHFASLIENRVEDSQAMEAILNSQFVQKPTNIQSLISCLHSLKNYYSKLTKECTKVIIIDSISVPLFPFIGQTHNEGLSFMNHVALAVKFLAVEYHATVLMVNLAARYYDTDEECLKQDLSLKPMLGKHWIHVPNVRLTIQRPDATQRLRTIHLTKSDSSKTGKYCTINLLESGHIISC